MFLCRELEEENATLQAEYERLRSQQSPSMSFSLSSSPDETTPLPQGASNASNEVEKGILHEALLLRQHKNRLETRMRILEEHNRQLEIQLGRLRQLLDEVLKTCFFFLCKTLFENNINNFYEK